MQQEWRAPTVAVLEVVLELGGEALCCCGPGHPLKPPTRQHRQVGAAAAVAVAVAVAAVMAVVAAAVMVVVAAAGPPRRFQ